MQYKDLIYKITSTDEPVSLDKSDDDVNLAKKSFKTSKYFIGVIAGKIVLNKGISDALKNEIDRKLTVLFNSPISNEFSFLPYDKIILTSLLDLFPDRNFNYVSTEEDYDSIIEIKKTKMNLSNVFKSTNVDSDFVDKLDYLVTINFNDINPAMKARLENKNVLIFPLTFYGTANNGQPEKLVSPDPSGWKYNPASGIWAKNWGRDGSAEIPSWKAPNDWNLDPNPKLSQPPVI